MDSAGAAANTAMGGLLNSLPEQNQPAYWFVTPDASRRLELQTKHVQIQVSIETREQLREGFRRLEAALFGADSSGADGELLYSEWVKQQQAREASIRFWLRNAQEKELACKRAQESGV